MHSTVKTSEERQKLGNTTALVHMNQSKVSGKKVSQMTDNSPNSLGLYLTRFTPYQTSRPHSELVKFSLQFLDFVKSW
jgi:hypothetical protein